MPFVGLFISLLTPLPFLYYATKLGLYKGMKLAAFALFTIGLIAKLIGQPHIILLGIELGLLGFVLSELFKRKLGVGQTIFLATLFMLLLGLVCLFFIGLWRNMGPLEVVLNYLEGHLEATLKAYEELGIPQENAIGLRTDHKAILNTMAAIYASLVAVGTGFTVWLNVILAKPLFRFGNLRYPAFILMSRWQAPDILVWGVIASGFALFFFEGGIKWMAINALIVMLVIYLFHGLSIVLFFLSKYNVPSWMRVGVYFFIIIQQPLMVILALAGLFDQWVDFRKIYKRAQD